MKKLLKLGLVKIAMNSSMIRKNGIIIEGEGYCKVYDKSFQINTNEGNFDK